MSEGPSNNFVYFSWFLAASEYEFVIEFVKFDFDISKFKASTQTQDSFMNRRAAFSAYVPSPLERALTIQRLANCMVNDLSELSECRH